jgi:hypothetical protein
MCLSAVSYAGSSRIRFKGLISGREATPRRFLPSISVPHVH